MLCNKNKVYTVVVHDPDKRIGLPRRMTFFHLWLRKLWILSAVDRVFFGLVLYTLYFAVGKYTNTSEKFVEINLTNQFKVHGLWEK